jgi:stage III sporulation protein SpoIIIAA
MADLSTLLELLSARFKGGVLGDVERMKHELVDVLLDKGRIAHAYLSGNRRVRLVEHQSTLGEKNENGPHIDEYVTEDDIESVTHSIGLHRFGHDNRAGLDRQLHRISATRNLNGDIYGMTMRVGRAVTGVAEGLRDILLSSTRKSVLFIGRPGSGKTTHIRDVARLLSDYGGEIVCVIDTSNEIGRDGDVPHSCIGFARRMMVPSLDMQAKVMVECVQNHTVPRH